MAALLAVIASPPLACAQASSNDAIQQRFGEAMQLLEAGRADEAAIALRLLALQTDAPRIRLELARALYFQGRLKEARAEFMKVYVQPNLPYAVRRTVNVFLADIDQRAGYFQPSLSLAFDSNPQQTPPSGIYDIFGIPLTFESAAKPQTGVSVEANGAAPLGRSGWSVIGAAGLTRFPDPDLGQVTGSLGLRRPDGPQGGGGRGGWWGGGATYYERQGYSPATTVYVERVRRLTRPDQGRQLVGRIAVSRIAVRDAPNLDGWGLDGALDYGRDLTPNAAVNLTLSAGSAGAQYAVDRRVYASLAGGVTAALPRWNKTVSFRLSGGQTRFGDTDPFFGAVREDRYGSAEARLLDGRPIHGLFPSVSLTWERRSSSIGFFDYERTGFNVGLQRRF
jgi:hypothetical protein